MNTDLRGGALAGAGTAGSAAVTELTIGLDRARQAAGDVLSGIFGGLPWDLSPSAIVDAVGGGGSDAAATLVSPALDVLGVAARVNVAEVLAVVA